MSVAIETTSAELASRYTGSDIDMALTNNGLFVNTSSDADQVVVDPFLTMPYSANIGNKAAETAFEMSPSIWDHQLDGPSPLFDQVKHDQDSMGATAGGDEEPLTPTQPKTSAAKRRSSRPGSDSSVPSLVSSTSSQDVQPKKKTRRSTRKKQPSSTAKQNIKAEAQEDSKRNKYLERNRLAASKCRQKKKEWVHDLEEKKGMLETRHKALQQEYSTLLGQVSEMKSFIMSHSGCNDIKIDQWIEGEARKFVRKSMDGSFAALGRHPSGSSSLPTSQSRHSSIASVSHFSPAESPLDAGNFASRTVKDEEINFDHMPDDMFQ